MEKITNFNFYGVRVLVKTQWEELSQRLRDDFSFFLVNSKNNGEEKGSDGCLSLEINQGGHLDEFISGKKLTSYGNKVKFYTKNSTRTCSYPSGAYSQINFKTNEALIEASELHAAHELAYLLILSRVGKLLDLKGLHRLHGAAFVIEHRLCVLAFSSGIGKSTLLAHVIDDQKDQQEGSFSLYSDDSPLVDRKGRVYPFPLRLGFESSSGLPEFFQNKPSYKLRRHHYGEKVLFSIESLPLTFKDGYEESFLVLGNRGKASSVRKISSFGVSRQLFMEGVVGFGLPILFEYFWEPGVKDFFRKTYIALSRALSLMTFTLKAQKYRLTLEDTNAGGKPEVNAKFLLKFLKGN